MPRGATFRLSMLLFEPCVNVKNWFPRSQDNLELGTSQPLLEMGAMLVPKYCDVYIYGCFKEVLPLIMCNKFKKTFQ